MLKKKFEMHNRWWNMEVLQWKKIFKWRGEQKSIWMQVLGGYKCAFVGKTEWREGFPCGVKPKALFNFTKSLYLLSCWFNSHLIKSTYNPPSKHTLNNFEWNMNLNKFLFFLISGNLEWREFLMKIHHIFQINYGSFFKGALLFYISKVPFSVIKMWRSLQGYLKELKENFYF